MLCESVNEISSSVAVNVYKCLSGNKHVSLSFSVDLFVHTHTHAAPNYSQCSTFGCCCSLFPLS